MQDRPWLEHYPPDVPKTLAPFPARSLFSLLEDSARRHPDRPATAFFGKHLTYEQLLGRVERFSAVLAGLGIRQGDRVALVLPNCPQYVIAYYATARIGAVVVGNNPLYTPRELAFQLSDAGVKATVVLEQLYPLLSKAQQEGAETGPVIVAKLNEEMRFPLNLLAPIKFRRDAKAEGNPWPPVPRDADITWWRDAVSAAGATPPVATVDAATEPAGFIYTGGTTGPAKAAMLSHANLVANAMQGQAWFPDIRDGHEGMMCILPFFHSFGMLAMNVGVISAMKLIMVPRFELHMVLKEIAKEKPTYLPGVPRLYIQINEAEESRKYDLRSVTACVSGAAPLPMAVARRFKEVTGGAEVVEGYGLTECSPVTHANPFNGTRKEGSIGMPVPDTECKIVDLENPDKIQAVGEPGELCIRGPQVMLGYWNRPEESALAVRNGWFHTGDVAVMDADGYFSIVDRLKDMILVSGFNVYPTEIEEVLFRHQKILKACVVGVPDEKTGEAVKAFVVLKPGEHITADDLVEWCRDPSGGGLTRYRVPKQIEFRDSLPETLVGKVLRRVLLEEERKKQEVTRR
ncbi:MAG: long-chain fatty acid--CoA ligase [Actinomycetota bacterium]